MNIGFCDLSDAIGSYSALNSCRDFGGRSVDVREISRTLPKAARRALRKLVGSAQVVELPHRMALFSEECRQWLLTGASVSEVTEVLPLSKTHVYGIRRQLVAEGLLEPLEPCVKGGRHE